MLSELRPIHFSTELVIPPLNLSTHEAQERHRSRIKQVFQTLRDQKGIDFNKVDVDTLRGPHLVTRAASGHVKSYAFLASSIRAVDERTERTLDEFAHEVQEVVSVSFTVLRIPIIMVQSCVIRATVKPYGYNDARDFLFHHGLGLPGRQVVEQFGRPAAVAGMRITFPPLANTPNEHRVRIESYGRDPSLLFLEVMSIFPKTPIAAPQLDRIVTHFEECYAFLEERVCPFVDSLAGTSGA